MVKHARARGALLVLAATLFAACSSSSYSPMPTSGLGGNGNGTVNNQGPTAAASAGPANVVPPQAAASAAASAAGGTTKGTTGLPGTTPGSAGFSETGLNPYVSTAQDHLSTFGLDVDTASYTVARSALNSGQLPDPASVRVEEWVNYFDQGYAAPETNTFAIYADGANVPFLTGAQSPNEVVLRIGVKARTVSRVSRPDTALTFVIDTSGSMGDDNKLEMVKSSLRVLVDQLRPNDTVGIVAFSTDARVVLPPTSGADRNRILGAIDELEPQATTNVQAGLTLGYQLARESMIEGGANRVVLASDGVANVGATDAASILEGVARDAAAGIQEVSIGVGMGNYNDSLLEQLADKGQGFYAYIDTEAEAHRLFANKLVSTIDTVALDGKAQVDFNPNVVAEYRLIGYENRAIADNQFRNNNVPAGTIGAGHSVTALYALRLREGFSASDQVATVTLRWNEPGSTRATELSQDILGSDVSGSWATADPHLRLDTLVAGAAETFRGSPWISDFSIAQLADAADRVRADLPQSAQVDEFLGLLDTAAKLYR
jgi:Ca-activated chloride channel family protein